MSAETITILAAGGVSAAIIGFSLFHDDIADAYHRRQVRKLTKGKKKK